MKHVVKASEFKATCLRLMDEVADTGETVVITKNGVPVAELVPVKRAPASILGALAGTPVVKGDLVPPVEVEWEVESSGLDPA